MAVDRMLFSDGARRSAFIKKAKIIIVVGGVVGVLMGGFIAHQLSHVFSKENTHVTQLTNPITTQDKE